MMLVGFFVVLGAFSAVGVTLSEMRDRPVRRAEQLARAAAQPAE
jgi:hypothetical protein